MKQERRATQENESDDDFEDAADYLQQLLDKQIAASLEFSDDDEEEEVNATRSQPPTTTTIPHVEKKPTIETPPLPREVVDNTNTKEQKPSEKHVSSIKVRRGPEKKPAIVQRHQNMTVFGGDDKYNDLNSNTIHHRSLDKTEEEGALTISDLKKLKRKRHEMEQSELIEQSKEFKKLKKGPAFDVEKSSRSLQRKNEHQRELDKLTFDIKSFVYSQTMKPDEYDREMHGELLRQGKHVSKIKNKAVNYKEYIQKMSQDKSNKKSALKESRELGTFNAKEHKKELIKKKQQKQQKEYRFLSRFGAPNDIGVADERMKSKYALGTVGKFKRGMLTLSQREIRAVKYNKNK